MSIPKNLTQFMKVVNTDLTLTMVQHDWMPTGKLMGVEREVTSVRSKAIKFVNGSWLVFDNGAKGVKFEGIKLTVDLIGDGKFTEVMVYEMKLKE